VIKFTGATTGGNSGIQDNGTVGVYFTPEVAHELLAVDYDYTVGTDYARYGHRSGIGGGDFNVQVYEFGTSGHSYNDYTRCGGVLGAQWSGGYWGSLGYKNSGSTSYGVYGSSGYASGGGYLPSKMSSGIGGGFYGDMIGSVSRGSIVGQMNAGELFATYNLGDVYTSGRSIELVNTGEARSAAFAVTSPDITVYKKGKASMVNGSVYVAFDQNFKALLGETPIVTVTPMGACNGVYISAIDQNGFTLTEQNNGTHSVDVAWIAVGDRVDGHSNTEVPAALTNGSFDQNLKATLHDDSNKESSAQGIWWDGANIQFGTVPASTYPKSKAEQGIK
jgi:hypothetical protein